jgi:copper resistance protein D
VVRFLNIYGFLAVLLRAATLVFQSLVIGGIVFRIAVLKRLDRDSSHAHNIRSACDKLLRVGILALVVTQAIFLFVNSAVLMVTARLTPRDLLGANYVFSGLTIIAVGAALPVLLGRRAKWSLAGMLVSCVALLVATVTTNHAAARIEGRFLLSLLTGLHLSGAFIWVGGLPYLLLAIAKSGGEDEAGVFTARFSRLALICVGVLLLSGITISYFYVDSPKALYGTAYGVMLGAKAALLGLLLLLGRLNYGIVHAFRAGEIARRLRRFAEVEVTIGFAAILAAASLTSQPPAVDLKVDRVSASAIYERMRPRLPHLKTPSVSQLSPSSRQAEKKIIASASAPSSFVAGAQIIYPNTPADIAWSEYNHNWVGLLVLSMGLLALMTRGGHLHWSRHWPLIFLVLSVFILLRADLTGSGRVSIRLKLHRTGSSLSSSRPLRSSNGACSGISRRLDLPCTFFRRCAPWAVHYSSHTHIPWATSRRSCWRS